MGQGDHNACCKKEEDETKFLKSWNELYAEYRKETDSNLPKIKFTGTKSGSIHLRYRTRSQDHEKIMVNFIEHLDKKEDTHIENCPFTNHKTESQAKKEFLDKKQEEIEEGKLRRKKEKQEQEQKEQEQKKQEQKEQEQKKQEQKKQEQKKQEQKKKKKKKKKK